MAEVNKRMAAIRLKVDRARKHLGELEAARNQFFADKPYVIESRRNSLTGFDEFSVTNLREPPTEIGLIAGDAIHNLRSSLDHLAYELVLSNGMSPTKQTSFPIFDDEATYRSHRAGRVKGMAPLAIAAIDGIKPFQGGANELWILHSLDIADKHHSYLLC
jgi:hypothetical protein